MARPQELNSNHRNQYQTEINNEYLSSLPVLFSDCLKVSAINHRPVAINDKTQSKPYLDVLNCNEVKSAHSTNLIFHRLSSAR